MVISLRPLFHHPSRVIDSQETSGRRLPTTTIPARTTSHAAFSNSPWHSAGVTRAVHPFFMCSLFFSMSPETYFSNTAASCQAGREKMPFLAPLILYSLQCSARKIKCSLMSFFSCSSFDSSCRHGHSGRDPTQKNLRALHLGSTLQGSRLRFSSFSWHLSCSCHSCITRATSRFSVLPFHTHSLSSICRRRRCCPLPRPFAKRTEFNHLGNFQPSGIFFPCLFRLFGGRSCVASECEILERSFITCRVCSLIGSSVVSAQGKGSHGFGD